MPAPEPFRDIDLPLPGRRVGKVRISYDLSGDRRLFVTTDRLSAFDRIVTAIPWKGQVLNQLSAWWFAQTRHIVANHVQGIPDPNVTVATCATPLPVEVVVRAYMTGSTSTSIWRQYAAGARTIYGYDFPDGIRKNTALPQAIITPTTKADAGAHDEPLTCAEVVSRGLVDAPLWDRVQAAALALFAHGQAVASRAGLILADTKYEFGLAPDGTLLLIDEVHTPDSSRFWEASSHEARLAAGLEPESLDKEPIRLALDAMGYRGDGDPPVLGPEVVATTSSRYQTAYSRLTGLTFEPAAYPADVRIRAALATGEGQGVVLPSPPGRGAGGEGVHGVGAGGEGPAPLAVIVMGSPADGDHARAIADALHGFHIDVVQRVGSAHRTPEHVLNLLREHDADPRPKVFITVAGRSNALSGFTDPQVAAPVIACPPPGPEIDAWSSLRMPPGVGCAVVLEPVNAALFAAKILATHNPRVAQAVAAYQSAQRDRVTRADEALRTTPRLP